MTNEERQQHIKTLKRMLNQHSPYSDSDLDAAVAAGIESLEREGQMEAQPSPDLESVRKLLKATELLHSRASYEEAVTWQVEVAGYADRAEVPLKSLLAEVEHHRIERNALCYMLEKMEAENKQLREEIKRLWEAKDLAVLSERESCARIALGSQISETSLSAEWGRQCAAAILRERLP
jgi:hypothetical protein